MDLTEAIVTVLLAIFGVGGPFVIWLNRRENKKPEITTEEAEATTTTIAVEELGIEERWMNHATRIEIALNSRIDKMEERHAKTLNSLNSAIRYIDDLRAHIHKQLPPPPPPWPDDIT